MPNIDIIIPVYNEGDNILDVLDVFCASVKTPFRVLICYDHENDNTLEALKKFSGGCEVLTVQNQGQGAHGAVLTGFRTSNADAVIMWPADDTVNAGIVDQMSEKFQQGSEIVAASRFIDGGCMEGAPWLKSFLVRTSAFTLYYLARLPTRDASNGLRLFSRKVIDQIEVESSVGFAYSIELLVKCHRLGWNIAEIPALWFERTRGTSRFKVLRWLPEYLRWYSYAFATTYLRRGPHTVPLKKSPA
ncbi:MAG: glycosyltransferase family 2 protein [bacterium]|nr:glycosyltransferase family 2 protein [bacterium]